MYQCPKAIANISRPFYVKGCAIGCGFTGSIVILSLGLWFRMRQVNKRKDQAYGTINESEQLDITELGEKHPAFRYLL